MPPPGLLFPQAYMASTAGMLQDHWDIAAWGIAALARPGTAAVFTLRERVMQEGMVATARAAGRRSPEVMAQATAEVLVVIAAGTAVAGR